MNRIGQELVRSLELVGENENDDVSELLPLNGTFLFQWSSNIDEDFEIFRWIIRRRICTFFHRIELISKYAALFRYRLSF